jgi:hypothetical protein
MGKPFEKIFLCWDSAPYSYSIAAANCPDDWSLCSLVLASHRGDHHDVTRVLFDPDKLKELIEALQAIQNDMPKEIDAL